MCGSALNLVERSGHRALRQDKATDDLARQALRGGREQEVVVDEREAMTIAADPAQPAAGSDDRLLESVRPEMQKEREIRRHRQAARPSSARQSRRSGRSAAMAEHPAIGGAPKNSNPERSRMSIGSLSEPAAIPSISAATSGARCFTVGQALAARTRAAS